MRILGIDPGSLATGFGVVEQTGSQLDHVVHGTIRPPRGAPIHQRLALIYSELLRVIEQHVPDRAVIEAVFVSASPRSALVLGLAGFATPGFSKPYIVTLPFSFGLVMTPISRSSTTTMRSAPMYCSKNG